MTARARFAAAATLVTTIAMSTSALADEGARRADQALALGCHTCHSPAIRGPSAIPPLGGSGADLLTTLLAFKRDQRPATIMNRIAKGYEDDQLARIATFIADEAALADKAR